MKRSIWALAAIAACGTSSVGGDPNINRFEESCWDGELWSCEEPLAEPLDRAFERVTVEAFGHSWERVVGPLSERLPWDDEGLDDRPFFAPTFISESSIEGMFFGSQELSEVHVTEEAALGCTASDDACVLGRMLDVANTLLRRTLSAEESAAIAALLGSEGDKVLIRRLVLRFLVTAPESQFIVERGIESGAWIRPEELASRLALAFWVEGPDSELLGFAGGLDVSVGEDRSALAQRIIGDPRSSRGLYRFHRQWLSLQPQGDEALDFARETELFVQDLFSDPGATFGDLFTARFRYLNQPLADFYGVGGTFDGFQRTELDSSAGILVHGSFLSTHGAPSIRGNLLVERVLCSLVPSLPANIDPIIPEGMGTRRQQLESALSPECQSCHQLIDPIGFAFESFDEDGRFRTMEAGQNIDSSWELSCGESGEGPAEFGELLANDGQAAACYANSWFQYLVRPQVQLIPSNGRVVQDCVDSSAYQTFRESGGGLRDLVISLASNDAMAQVRPTLLAQTLGPTTFPASLPPTDGLDEQQVNLALSSALAELHLARLTEMQASLDHVEATMRLEQYFDGLTRLLERFRALSP